ncbi:hypothetical protein M9Y10_003554 [Tritrichomonas musculus]|uniref:HIT-type domain-containing protein n=1 Tax=Tritrichomonas musculus TaxID=1915356 RepID=A0ABR2JPQ8_9EUKA
MICSVCGQNKSSYRCPKCKMPYCCLNCYKIHKNVCPGVIDDEKPQNDARNNQQEEISIPPFELFRSNPEIIRALGDPRLQKIISRIDSAKDRENELVNEMEINPDFNYFVEQLLKSCPPSIQP